jgi:tetratricopeptide (TPR) repeat protein/cytochrome oxidase Cu insertion factor (SCO1/SenC/PrrC family)
MVSAGLRGFAFPSNRPFDHSGVSSSNAEFHLHPHYLAQWTLDDTLLKVKPGLDSFLSEKYHDQIAAVLAEWSSDLVQSPQQLQAIENVLATDFSGSSLLPVDSRTVRPGPPIEVHQNKFASRTDLGRDAFLQQLRSSLSSFSRIATAEFQVTSIQSSSGFNQAPPQLRTRVRFELVGSGQGFHREQRVGYWDLEWESAPPSSTADFRLLRWQVKDETRSRSVSPTFADVTAAAMGADPSYSAQLLRGVDYWRTVLDGACGVDIYGHNGVSVADVDNDGFDDLYICQPAGLPNRLFRNRGDGTFEDITTTSGLGLLDNTACALFADFDKDYDCDGWLDIYFCLYSYYQGTDQYKYPVPYHDAENGPPNFMMRNNRDGTFRDVTAESGLNQNNTRYSFCCGWSDYNRDGWPDLYVVNDFGRKNLYRNNGNGTFTDVAAQAGVEDIGAGMSVCWNDFDNDGAEDLCVADMWTSAGERISSQEIFKKDVPEDIRSLYRKHAMGNSLFRNRKLGNGVQFSHDAFEDVTSAAGVGMGRWSWSSDSFDFDHDGFPDLYIANGMVSGPSRQDLNSFFWRQVVANSPDRGKSAHDYEQGWSAINELIRADGTWSGLERNVFYANNRDGTFSDVSGAIGLDFIEDGRAFALADFDQDGRQEIFLKNRNAPQLRLLKNIIENLPPSIAFRLRGTKSNRDAIGAAITVETELCRQTRTLQAGSGFLSQHSKEVFFGLGECKSLLRASIRWPSGLVQYIHDLAPNHRIWVEEGSEKLRLEPFKAQASSRPPLSVIEGKEIETFPAIVETWLMVPVAAPEFSLRDLTGEARSLSTLRAKPVLLNFWTAQSTDCLNGLSEFQQFFGKGQSRAFQLLTVSVDDDADPDKLSALARQRYPMLRVLRGSNEVCAVYNILYRYLFDRHRDLGLPTSFLIDRSGDIVKIYQGPVKPERAEQDSIRIPQNDSERMVEALPFPGVSENFEFGRNYLSIGSVYFQRGYMDQAAASFQLALRDDPSSAEACYGLGSVYLSQQKTAGARESFERTTKLHASYPDTLANAWNNLGLLATREGKTEEAIHYFKEALRLSPGHMIALNNLGNAYRLQKNWDAARQSFERALDASPSDAEANYGLAMVFAQADDSARAYEYLQRALKARPVYPEALNNLAILYLRTQRRDQAISSFEECIRVAPYFDQSYLNLARVYALEDTPEKARSVLLELLKQYPDHAQAQNMLAHLPH